MKDLRFEWDLKKSATNRRKHGVSFEDAQTAFSDEFGLIIDDPEHSEDETRFVLLGLSASLRLLLCVIAIEQVAMSFESFQLVKPTGLSPHFILEADYEKAVRLFKRSTQSLCKTPEETADNSA